MDPSGEGLRRRHEALQRARTRVSPDVAIRAPKLPLRPLDTGVTVVRPDDLLVLTFDRVNLRLEPGERGARLVKAGDGPAFLVVELQPQQVVERAYFESAAEAGYAVSVPGVDVGKAKELDPDVGADAVPDPPEEPPIPSIIARPSRLVFRVPDELLPLDFDLETLLAAMHELEPSVTANALPPQPHIALRERLFPHTAAALGAAPDDAPLFRPAGVGWLSRARRKARTTESALGLSTLTGSESVRLLSAFAPPGVEARWPGVLARALQPVPEEPSEHQTAIEMPYRLVVSPSRRGRWFHRVPPATSDETGKTELWHTRLGVRLDSGERVDGVHPENVLRAVWTWDPEPTLPLPDLAHYDDPWRMSLDAYDRVNVVHLTSDFALDGVSGRAYRPTPLEVDLFMLSSLGAWMDTRGAWRDQPPGLSVEEWRHRATLGRDHYVRVVYAGFLFPFGHRASVIKVTERKLHAMPSGRRAYLRQRMYLVVREPVRTFRHSGLRTPEGDSLDLQMPFEVVRITTRASPDLDPPESDDISGRRQACFWPRVRGAPFRFHLVARDVEGNTVDMTAPLIFVGKEVADLQRGVSPPPELMDVVAAEYEQRDGGARATVELHGQKVAFARSEAPDDTSFAVDSITFAGIVPAERYNTLPRTAPRFFPGMRRAAVNVPSMQRLARTSAPSSLVYASVYLQDEFEGDNAGDVFLAADAQAAATDVAFSKQSDRSGGFVAPDLRLAGISRLTGPVAGKLDTAALGQFDPTEYFGALAEAKLFGAISLAELVDGAGLDELAKIPRFAGQSLNQVERLLADLEQLTHDLDGTALAAHGVVGAIGNVTTALAALEPEADVSGAFGQLQGLVPQLQDLQAGLPALKAGPRAVADQRVNALLDALPAVDPTLLGRFVKGDALPEALTARFEWRPQLVPLAVFTPPADRRGLVVAVESAAKGEGPGEEHVTVTASLDDFTLNLVAVVLGFEHVQFRMRDGKKPEIDVKLKGDGVQFAGPLAFVDTLRHLIPLDGFADPPAVDVSEEGITAGFSVGLPNLAVGVLSLEHLSLGAGFAVPFVGPPMSVWFRFCEREHPAQLTVMMFGGGAFFGVTMNADGIQVLEAAFEFGAAISVDFGVASGGVSAMAGIYFKLETSHTQLTGYFRLRGEVEALGLVSVCIELYLDLSFETPNKCVGTATLSIEVDVALFSATIELKTTKKFAGSGDDPTLRELYDVAPDETSADWEAYCAAFA